MTDLEKDYKEWFEKHKKRLKKMYNVYLQEIEDTKTKSFEDWAWDYYESVWE